MKRITPQFPSETNSLSPRHKEFLVNPHSPSPAFSPQEIGESESAGASDPNSMGADANLDGNVKKQADSIRSLAQISNIINPITGKRSLKPLDNNEVIDSVSTSAQNHSLNKANEILPTKDSLSKCTEPCTEEGVFKRSRVDIKRYQAKVPDSPEGKDSELEKLVEEVKERCQFDGRDSECLEIISSFLQFAQWLNNQQVNTGANGP